MLTLEYRLPYQIHSSGYSPDDVNCAKCILSLFFLILVKRNRVRPVEKQFYDPLNWQWGSDFHPKPIVQLWVDVPTFSAQFPNRHRFNSPWEMLFSFLTIIISDHDVVTRGQGPCAKRARRSFVHRATSRFHFPLSTSCLLWEKVWGPPAPRKLFLFGGTVRLMQLESELWGERCRHHSEINWAMHFIVMDALTSLTHSRA